MKTDWSVNQKMNGARLNFWMVPILGRSNRPTRRACEQSKNKEQNRNEKRTEQKENETKTFVPAPFPNVLVLPKSHTIF